MTWRELRKKIDEMRPHQLDQEVMFCEPYDEGTILGPVMALQCLQDYHEDLDPDRDVVVKEGDFMLFCGK